MYYLAALRDLLVNPGYSGIVNQKLHHISLHSLIMGFGFLTPFLLWNLFYLFDKRYEFFLLKLVFIIQVLFLFLPLGYTLFFQKGIFLWGVIIALDAIFLFVTKKKITLLLIVLIFSMITRFYSFNILLNVDKNNSFFFLTDTEGKSIQNIKTLPLESNILSLYRIGNYIPAHTDSRVYYGHNLQTPNAKEKVAHAQQFYVFMNEEEQRSFAKENNIQYVYYGLEESKLREINEKEVEDPFSYFKAVYNKDGIIIYKVD